MISEVKISNGKGSNGTAFRRVLIGAAALMLGVMLPAFLLAMYERDGLPLEKVARNIIRAKFRRSGHRPYRTDNIYAPFTLRGAMEKEDAIAKNKHAKKKARKG